MWDGERGRASGSLLQRFVPNVTSVPVFLCGPNEMMDATREILRGIGVPDSLVRVEAFAGRKAVVASSRAAAAVESNMVERNGTPIVSPPVDSPERTTLVASFHRSKVQAFVSADTTILEAAESVSVALPFECRSGFCGQCKTRLVEGEVQMDCEDALSPSEKTGGWIWPARLGPHQT